MPSTMTRPRSGLIRPTSDLRNTVFPVPEGPSITLTSPAGSDSVTSRHTTWRPKDLVSPSTTTSVPISPPWVSTGDDSCPSYQLIPSAAGAVGLGSGTRGPPHALVTPPSVRSQP